MKDDEKEIIKKIISIVKNGTWREIDELGINHQQAQKIRAGKEVRFYSVTLDRIRKKLHKGK